MAPGGPRTSVRARWALAALVAGYAAIDLVAGAPRSPLVPPRPAGVGVPWWSVSGARLLGLDRLGPTALTMLAMALLVVLVTAFGVLVLEAVRGRVGLGPVLGAAGVSLALSVLAPLLLSRDVYSYAAYGRMFAIHGANPYVRPPSSFPGDPFTPVLSPEWLHTRSVYGPAFTLLSAAVARVWPSSPGAEIAAFKALAAIGIGGAAVLAATAVRAVRPDRTALAAAAVGLNPVLVVHTAGGGHNDAIVALCLAGAAALAVRSASNPAIRPEAVAVTLLLAAAALIKLPAAVPLFVWVCFVVRSAPGRRLASAAVHVVAAVALGVLVTVPVSAGVRTLNAAAAVSTLQGWASGPRAVARGAEALGRAIAGSAAASALGTVVYGVFLLAFAVILWRVVRRRDATSPAAWAASLLALAFAAAYLLPWYAAWFVPLLPFVEDDVILGAGLAVAGLLALTGVPAEPDGVPAQWHGMVLAVHYAVAPLMLALFAVVGPRLGRTAPRLPATDGPGSGPGTTPSPAPPRP